MYINLGDVPRYIDQRGVIRMILANCSIGSISKITTYANNWRARHYHPNDFHFCEILDGEIEYYEREHGSDKKPIKNIYRTGDIFYTPPNFDHEMIFNRYTVFNCYSKLPRSQENYEKETIRFNESLKGIYDNWEKTGTTGG
jgi:hypothetical protein